MKKPRIIATVLCAALLAPVALPRQARALDIASTVVAVGGGVLATVGIVMMTNEDPDKKKLGKTFMIIGLVVSGASSSTAVTLNLLVLATYDRLEEVELEAAAGGGPITDALARGFNVPPEEVIASVHHVQTLQPLRTEADARGFADRLAAELGKKASIPPELASTVVYELYAERGLPQAPRHQMLADLSGVDVRTLARIAAEEIDRELAAGAVPGVIVSARASLARNAPATLDRILSRIAEEHQDAVASRIDDAVEAATNQSGAPQ